MAGYGLHTIANHLYSYPSRGGWRDRIRTRKYVPE